MVLKHEQQHPQLKNTYAFPKIPASMLLKSYISVKEEQAMGITPQATSEYRDGFGMMKCDDPALDAYQGSIRYSNRSEELQYHVFKVIPKSSRNTLQINCPYMTFNICCFLLHTSIHI
jgi:hypothetical protein